jgi:hypothetical protein
LSTPQCQNNVLKYHQYFKCTSLYWVSLNMSMILWTVPWFCHRFHVLWYLGWHVFVVHFP